MAASGSGPADPGAAAGSARRGLAYRLKNRIDFPKARRVDSKRYSVLCVSEKDARRCKVRKTADFAALFTKMPPKG
ncbi:hypothetical protein E0H39_30845 [Rhizobium leguminosarum bv. viciae]|nr:hypothetical protein [Rhizobium leguminosarum bv. viciae]PUB61467.1 hypothetical protein DB728_26970 [Rhizobium leguminosarum bv. viciae USDA 2370]RWX42709.1 hypothetical protein EHH54_00150 [Rhizobium leguminosarum]NKK17496.1 hypothetical protein [Rhizobium leguminosarum bv. viciae]NKK31919.1 hypothetical protein [Rhizobium leguminosarum bv. viciae]